MQTLACTSSGQPVRADQASRHETYTCFECHRPLRLRSGRRRRPHFYHLGSSHCRYQNRSTFHVKIQNFLQQQLAPEKILFEQPFPTIRRIADLVWPAKQWIFEVQCSPITAEEVKSRMADYAKVGYQVIWILYDRQFHRPFVREAELILQSHPYLFISKDLFLYQQLSHIVHERRVATSKRYPIHLKTFDPNQPPAWTYKQIAPLTKKPRFSLKTPFYYLLEKMCS